jgi:hypothetical protein
MSTEVIERRPLTPLNVQQTKVAITQYQEGLKSLLDPSEDVQSFVDRKGGKHSFVKRSGWRKIALWCDLSIENKTIEIDRDPNGKPLRARVVARASAPSGRFAEGEGGCDLTEHAVTKPEHDLLAIAATRAVNRAVSNLVGLGAVSAEEMDGGAAPMAPAADPAHPYGPDATSDMHAEAVTAILSLWPAWSESDAKWMLDLLARNFGSLPEISVRTLKGLQWCVANPPKHAGPEFEEIVTPAAVEQPIASPTEAIPDSAGDEVDIDAIFDAERNFME